MQGAGRRLRSGPTPPTSQARATLIPFPCTSISLDHSILSALSHSTCRPSIGRRVTSTPAHPMVHSPPARIDHQRSQRHLGHPQAARPSEPQPSDVRARGEPDLDPLATILPRNGRPELGWNGMADFSTFHSCSQLTNSLSENCGRPVRREISSKSFTDGLERVVTDRTTAAPVRTKVLGLVRKWNEEFEGSEEDDGALVHELYDRLAKSGSLSLPPSSRPARLTPAVVDSCCRCFLPARRCRLLSSVDGFDSLGPGARGCRACAGGGRGG